MSFSRLCSAHILPSGRSQFINYAVTVSARQNLVFLPIIRFLCTKIEKDLSQNSKLNENFNQNYLWKEKQP